MHLLDFNTAGHVDLDLSTNNVVPGKSFICNARKNFIKNINKTTSGNEFSRSTLVT